MEDGTAGCQCDWLDENRRHERAEKIHGEILAFEGRGLAGVMDLLDYVDLSADGVQDPALFPWDLEAFVAQHNWATPARVARLAARVADEHELRRQRTRFTDSLGPLHAAMGWALERG